MSRALLISVRFHDGRYHGAGDWPPAPARLFQALVAGAARGRMLTNEQKAALAWLEALDAPAIVAPAVRDGSGLVTYVPNNDLDAVSGDPARVGEIRVPKSVRPRLFDAADALLYAWAFDEDRAADGHARAVCDIAGTVYQLGRGVDMAWCHGELVDGSEIEPRIARSAGVPFRPTRSGAGPVLLCPQPGSLASLVERFESSRKRFINVLAGRSARQLFVRPPNARFRAVRYDSPSTYLLFDIRKTGGSKAETTFAPQPLDGIVDLSERLRDRAAERLENAFADDRQKASVKLVFIGRNATEADKAARIRIIPLPSIGHEHADTAVRRVVVEVPPNCPLKAADIEWSFSGLELSVDPKTGEILSILIPAADRSMLDHYGIEWHGASRLWRTVTPAALPQWASRRRIDPARVRNPRERKSAEERIREEHRAAEAVVQALRHAGVRAKPDAIRVQREPFSGKSAPANSRSMRTRFAKERLWHVEIAFISAVDGPLIIGDGRYLGLGLMAPMKQAWRDVIVSSIAPEARVAAEDSAALLHATRRALMALSRGDDGKVPRLFSGHEENGAPAGSSQHEHIFLAADDEDKDGCLDRLIIAAPWACDRTVRSDDEDRACFDRVASGLKEVRAGRLGVISLGAQATPAAGDAVIGPAQLWESRTPYRPTRHAGRGREPTAPLIRDVAAECARRGLPQPAVDLAEVIAGPNGGIVARLRLRFAVAVEGPLMLGQDSHRGGGLFTAIG